ITADGTNDLMNTAQTSAPSSSGAAVTGDWGETAPATLHHFVITASNMSPLTATPITLTVRAEDASNNPIPNFSSSQVIAITTTGATPGGISFPNKPASLIVPAVVTSGPAEITASTAFDGSGNYVFDVSHNLEENVTYSATDQDTSAFGSSPPIQWTAPTP
ncbi:MAG: hypothetical protein QGH40_06895, partial [bacterium]|nr:hypothetical protein [bacterium]